MLIVENGEKLVCMFLPIKKTDSVFYGEILSDHFSLLNNVWLRGIIHVPVAFMRSEFEVYSISSAKIMNTTLVEDLYQCHGLLYYIV